jgi:SpoIID/LytB domain protein
VQRAVGIGVSIVVAAACLFGVVSPAGAAAAVGRAPRVQGMPAPQGAHQAVAALDAPAAATVEAAALPASLTIVGHGWGGGEGMGQYGALGYALAPFNWTYTQILGHFYSGTVRAVVSSTQLVNVRLDELDGATSVRFSAPPGGQLYLDGRPAASPAIVSRTSADQTVTARQGSVAVDVQVSGPWSTGAARSFVGTVVVKAAVAQVWNVLPLDRYVEGVVPRESPASWPLAALEAQAVAARSYALSHLGSSPPTVCDTTACQVYGGDPTQYPNSDSANSNAAVTQTAGQILEWGVDAPPGFGATQPALTEYSSSTGGYTAGGLFPAVVDLGDATPSNPNHSWTQSVPTSTVQAAYGGTVGTLQSIVVTQRNGLGDLGGRVLQLVLTGSAGRVTLTGNQFAAVARLRSNWFSVANALGSSGGIDGYWVVASNGAVYPFGSAVNYGSMVGRRLNAPVIGMATTFDGGGYWLVAGDGGIFSFGDAHFYGSTGNIRLNRPVIGMAPTPDGRGYWLFAGDGGVFTFGDARFYGSTGNIRLNQPVVGMTATPDGRGYWLVATDGGVFSFGDARFFGSTGNVRLAQPVVGMVATGTGQGYWLVGRDGGVFTFGNARFVGSLPGEGIRDTVTSVAATADGGGYLLSGAGGRVYTFGDAPFFGDPASGVPGWNSVALGVFAKRG